jgi:hypothetical protein
MTDDSTDPISVLHKHPKSRGFLQVENSTVRDPRLSLKATGLLVYLMSLQQGQPIGSRVIAEKKPDGRSAIMAAFKELRTFGYVEQESHRREDGTFTTTTHVYEVPPGAKTEPGFGLPGSDNPGSENRAISLTESKTERQRAERISLVCRECGQEGLAGMDALEDHQEFQCPALADPDGSFEKARDELKKAGGRG